MGRLILIAFMLLFCTPLYAGEVSRDNFDRTDRDLEGDTASGGGTWDDDAANGMLIATNQAAGDGNSTRGIRLDSDVGDDDMDVSLDINQSNDGADSSEWISVNARCPATSSCAVASYGCKLAGDGAGNSDGELYEFTTGSETSLGTWDGNLDDGTTHTVKIETRTNSQECFYNGTSRITATDTTISGNNYGGMGSRDNESRADDFLIEDVAAGGTRRIFMIATAMLDKFIPNAYADKEVEYYESEICNGKEMGLSDHNWYFPCELLDENGAITNKAERTKIDMALGKMWIRVENPKRGEFDRRKKRTLMQLPLESREKLIL